MYEYCFVQTAKFMLLLKKHCIRYHETVYERDGINYFGQLKIPMMFSINLNLKTLRLLNCLHCILRDLIILKDKLIDLIN